MDDNSELERVGAGWKGAQEELVERESSQVLAHDSVVSRQVYE